MDINYYDEHQEEFEAVKLALKGEMERIWGSMLKERGENLDDEATYLSLFEELQFNFSPSSFSKLTPSQELDEDKIAAFVARTRGYKYGITINCQPARPQKWLKGRIQPLEDAAGTNLCWIDITTIEHIGAGQQFDDQFFLTVSTQTGQSYRVNDLRLPGRLLNAAHEALFRALDSSTGGNF
ncbi:hypothetical protein [Escherichia coli]|uniref:hypothetical protein n=1 Tax=Escherichia coli TaxID=562 RepID=UPI001C99360A|nr:hypothetical protein [Escherichia coli]HDT5858256.1 hypothetical protein [Klebsiella quasipneumoniae subsp. similipneumoniae]QZO82017.1 hypothetical protein K5O11_23665 [Escherichia coli]HDT5873460.1 hypothetical protein [Klebsiella quasipneumoniae subsp. similipneumoniae]HDT5944705.1 hypothetical protein [Klebsiella quasipneumoniae subsp. similipneumoniae]HDT5956177.1 hypothetical protein [Klebsiella quasipneumoniae subsp. similipneumoniae]